jgi:hypothetical protein
MCVAKPGPADLAWSVGAARCAFSVAVGTMPYVPTTTATPQRETAEQPPLTSHTGVPLTRSVTFRFTLDPTRGQHQQLLAHAGAARLAFNHQIGDAVTELLHGRDFRGNLGSV